MESKDKDLISRRWKRWRNFFLKLERRWINSNDDKVIIKLIQKNQELLNQKNNDGYNQLMMALRCTPDWNLIKIFIDNELI